MLWYKFTNYWKELGKCILTSVWFFLFFVFFLTEKVYGSKDFMKKHVLSIDLFNTHEECLPMGIWELL